MYAYIKGTVTEVSENVVVLDVGGVGYEIYVSMSTLESCRVGEVKTLYTFLNVKEDEMSLFGFADKAEKKLFISLKSVGGIGPKLALTILGGMKLRDLALNIVSGNSSALSGIKGIGKKTAERIVIELKDKLSADFEGTVETPLETELTGKAEEAAMVLVALGYKREAAIKAVSEVFSEDMTVNQIVHKALGR